MISYLPLNTLFVLSPVVSMANGNAQSPVLWQAQQEYTTISWNLTSHSVILENYLPTHYTTLRGLQTVSISSGPCLKLAETRSTSVAPTGTMIEQSWAFFLSRGENQIEHPSELNLAITTKSAIAKDS